MATNKESTPVHDGAILFANTNQDDDPFQALSNANAPAKMTETSKPVAKTPEEPVAGDASTLFGNDTNGFFDTSDSLFPNAQAEQADPFFSQQLEKPQQQQQQEQYGAYYGNAEQTYGQQQYDQSYYQQYAPQDQYAQQTQYTQQEQYAQQNQYAQDQYGQYDPYANYQYQQQQDPYAPTAYQPASTTATTTATTTNNNTTTNNDATYYDQSSYDPQQQYDYYANYGQTDAFQTQPAESQQYSPYDPAAAQQQDQYSQYATQPYEYTDPKQETTAQYNVYDPAAQQQQQDTYSQYAQQQQQQQQQQPQQPQQQYDQQSYYGKVDQTGTEVQSTQQEEYAAFETGADQQQQDAYAQYNQYNYYAGYDQQQQASSEIQSAQQEQVTGFDTGVQSQQEQVAGFDTGIQAQQEQVAGFDTGVQSQQEQYAQFDTGLSQMGEQVASFDTGVYQPQQQAEGKPPAQEMTREIGAGNAAKPEASVLPPPPRAVQKSPLAPQQAAVPQPTPAPQQQPTPQQLSAVEQPPPPPQQANVPQQPPAPQQFPAGQQAPPPPPPASVAQEQPITQQPPPPPPPAAAAAAATVQEPPVSQQLPPPPKQAPVAQEQLSAQQPSPAPAAQEPPVPQQREVTQQEELKAEKKTEQEIEQKDEQKLDFTEEHKVAEPSHQAAEVPVVTEVHEAAEDQVVPTYAAAPYDPNAYGAHTYDANTYDASVYDANAYQQQPYTNSYAPEAAYTPVKPDDVHAMDPSVRSSIDQGSMLNRLASPDQQLFPCPDTNCEGENKAKAKFCCECGRPLTTGVSRSVTPIMSAVPAAAAVMPEMNNYQPYGTPMQQQQSQDMYTPDYGAEPATLMVGDEEPYYDETADAYEPQQPMDQAQFPPDPLNRARGCPIINFGFGGKLCVMFPQTVQRFTSQAGYESGTPITKTMPSAIKITKLKDIVGDHPMVSSLAQFPGPVLNDSKGGTKSKKKDVLTYLDKRIEELTAALPPPGDLDYHRAETRVLLWRLLKTLMETDGTIGDGDKMDNAVRALLQPPEKGEEDQGDFSVPAYAQASMSRDEDAENLVRSQKVLDKLQSYLVKGDRSGAVDYAMQEDLWAHALILSSCVNKEIWKKVVTSFVERELSQSAGESVRQDRLNVTGNKQALRVLYSLFAGAGANSLSEFLPTAGPQQRLGTPFGVPAATQPQATEEQLNEWQMTLTLILANRTPRDTEAITSLGDILKTHGWLNAAHICYLVSPQSSLHSGVDAPHVRLTLIGAEGTAAFSDLDAYYLTELYEFILSTKQGAASSLPFLQGYKLVHAWWLADFGFLGEAQRYCEAIANTIKGFTKGSPYLHRQLLENLKEFGDLCEATSGQSIGDTKSWVKNKLSKNMLESMWGSFEGKFNKFVSGDDIQPEEAPVRKSTEIMGTPYDAIKDGPPARSASAFDFRNANRSTMGPESLRRAATPTANMASEAYGTRRSSSPGVRATGHFSHGFTPLSQYETQAQEQPQEEPQVTEQQQDYGYGQNYGNYGYGAQQNNATTSPFGHSSSQQNTPSYYGQQEYGQGSQTYGHDTQQAYNQESQPAYGDQQQQNGYGGYGGWYDQQQQQQHEQQEAVPSYEPPTPAASNYGATYQEDDDLGFSNSALTKNKAPESENNQAPAVPEPSHENPTDKPHEADEKKTDEGKGWRIFSLFSRSTTPSNAPPGEKKAVKANLGEESKFYYDEKEKRWVNKSAGAAPAPAPLPPPPKASPAPVATPPPSAPATAASTPPPPAMMRSDSTPASRTMSPPGRSMTSPPPTAPPSGGRRAGRKPMRSRYVDVFNQQQ